MSSLLRSTKFVRYFTGAARTVLLNTAKTAEVATLVNSKAVCAFNNIIARDYAATNKSDNLEPLLQRLDLDVRRFGRITKKDIDEVLHEIYSKSYITSSQSLLVIRCCGELVPEELPEQRTLLVQKIWNVLIERGIPMDISHYNALLRVYIENEHPFSPAKLLEELENKGLQPNRVTYQRLMWRYCQDGDVEGATKVLEKMRELALPVSEPVLNALVMGHAFHGDTSGAKAVLDTMSGAGLKPSNLTYTLLACGFAREGDIDGVNNVIKTAAEKEVSLADRDILDIIEQLAIGGHGDKAEQLFGHLQKTVGYNQDVCNLILRLLNKGHVDTAKAVMKTMPKATNVEDTIFKGAFFVKQLLKITNDPDKVINICNELKEEGLVPNAPHIATEVALQLGKCETALKLFKVIEKDGIQIRQHFYWPLLVQKVKEDDEEGLIQILKTMSNGDQTPNGETLRDYVLPYMLKKDTPQNVITKLQIANVPTHIIARSVMAALLYAGSIKEAADIALTYRLRGQLSTISISLGRALDKTKDIDSFVSIIHVAISKSQISKDDENATNEERQTSEYENNHEVGRIISTAVKNLSNNKLTVNLLNAMQSKGIRIDTKSAQEIEQLLGKYMTTEISQLLTQLTSVDLEPVAIENIRRDNYTSAELENWLENIKNKGGGNVARVQKMLLLAYIKENNCEKVDSFLQELKSTDFELNAVTLAQLFEFYCINNQIEKAKEIKAHLSATYPDFDLNRLKLVLMAKALINNNQFDEAIQFLTENKPTEEIDDLGFTFNSKCWQILNDLAEQKESAKVLQLTMALIENNYIQPSNVILGPSIKVFLLNDDLEGALKHFEFCCNQYRSTPWKGELMKSLIMKEDANRLQWLADLSTGIHGEVNILHDLVLAFVECGRLRQARRILETPGMHTRQRRLDDACQRYVEEGKSEYLEGLLEATKELSNIDRSNIFYHLLKSYTKANETDKAVDLWTILQEEGEVPSEQFLRHLGKHLKSQNRRVPFVLPEDENKVKSVKTKKVSSPKSELIKSEVTSNIEKLVQQGKLTEALNVTIDALKQNVIPKPSVIKFLLNSLAEEGKTEMIQEIGKLTSDNLQRQIAYHNKLTLAVFNKGDGHRHIQEIMEKINTETDLEKLLLNYPRSKALQAAVQDKELFDKCYTIANTAASKGYYVPANIFWMECILAGKEKEADTIWNQWLIRTPSLLFRRLLQESYLKNDVNIVEKLLVKLKENKEITKGSLGNVYSHMIRLHLTNNNIDLVETTLRRVIEDGLNLERDINKTCMDKVKLAIKEAGREFNFQ